MKTIVLMVGYVLLSLLAVHIVAAESPTAAPIVALPEAAENMTVFAPGTRILFQGDSITDGGRGRTLDPNHILGQDYAYIIAAKYGAKFPDRNLTFLNRGVSGNKVTDLAARWTPDTLELKPDILSILIGINDASSVRDGKAGVSIMQYEQVYDQLLSDTVKALPNVKLVLCEPFVPPSPDLDDWHQDIQQRQQVVARLAAKYHAPVAHFQQVFNAACLHAPANYWLWDGVHPTYSGHQLMADEWVRVVSQFKWPEPPAPRQ